MVQINGLLLSFFMCSAILAEAKEEKYVCEPKLINIDTGAPITNLTEQCPNCTPKCCARNEIFIVATATEYPHCENLTSLNITLDYDQMRIFTSIQNIDKINSGEESETSKKNLSDVSLVQNKMFEKEDCVDKTVSTPLEEWYLRTYILENGKAAVETEYDGWIEKGAAYFCTDLYYNQKNKRTAQAAFVAKKKENKSVE